MKRLIYILLSIGIVFLQSCKEDKKDNIPFFGTLALAAGTGTNGATAPPTVQFTGSPFTFSKDVTIDLLTPTIGNTPFTNCVVSPSLPTGLSLSSSNCAISGTPTIVSPATVYTITASNSVGTGTMTLSIQVMASGVAPTLSYSGSPFTFTRNSAIAILTPTLGGGLPTSCSSSPALPTGLAINASSCAISGTPTVTQTATNHTITATNSFGSNTASISITVNAAGTAPTLSYSGSPFTFTQNSAITTISPTLGGSTPTSCSSSPALPTGLAINASSCAISGTPTETQTATTHTITATNSFGSNTTSISITVNAVGCLDPVVIQDLTYCAKASAPSGLKIQYVTGRTIQTIYDQANILIRVSFPAGTTATSVNNSINSTPESSTLVTSTISGNPNNPQTAPAGPFTLKP